MRRIERQLVAIIRAMVPGDLEGAIENPYRDIAGHYSQWPSDRLRRDRVIVEIEANIDGLVRAHGLDPVGGESVQRRRQQPGLFFGEDIGQRAVIAAGPATLVCDLIAPEQGLAIAFGQRGKGTARPERIVHVVDGSFHAALVRHL